MNARRRIVACAALVAWVSACAATPEFSGQVRPEYFEQRPAARGPLARAAALVPGIVELPASGPMLETELHASGYGLTAIATLQQQRLEHQRVRSHAWFDELYGSAEALGWQFSAGKRIVAWDVGYAFRPNDVVEQEVRRTLLTVTPEGRPLLSAEYFDASTAWSLVLVNPTQPRAQRGADEPALALRVYRRDGAVDWHGFARYGAHTGASLGAAAAWVADESTELHASLRWLNSADTLAIDPAATALVASNPWRAASVRDTAQALIGGTWTNAEQLSVLAEAWWDGSALSSSQWDAWNARNRGIAALLGSAAPIGAIAGNLAWQGSAFDASSNLRRTNLFVRASWTHEKWQPAIDMLYTPSDRGRVITAWLGWQGDRVRIDLGARLYGGPSEATLAQVPTRRTAFAAATLSF
jgi:hypothetical protein